MDRDEIILPALSQAISEGVTPGAVVAVVRMEENGKFIHTYACGSTAISGESSPVNDATVFDLASLTKPLVTSLLIMTMVAKGEIDIDGSTLVDLLPNIDVPKDKRGIRLRQMLSHSSGLPAHRPYFSEALAIEPARRKEWYLEQLISEKLIYAPGQEHIYSDLGFMLLGMAIEQHTGKNLALAYHENILEPLGLTTCLGFCAAALRSDVAGIAATEVCPWTSRMLQGVVHDDNCRAMGGVAGHAGLFGTVRGVVAICEVIIKVWQDWQQTPLFSRKILQMFFQRQPGTSWALGFDTPSEYGSSSGRFFSRSSVGHLGYTGTSMWLDLEKAVAVVLLTNRVHPTRKNEKIRIFRPILHDLVMTSLIES